MLGCGRAAASIGYQLKPVMGGMGAPRAAPKLAAGIETAEKKP